MRGASNHGNPPRLGLRRVADALLEEEPAPGRPESVSIRTRSATPMTSILTPLSVLSALVFGAMMVVMLAEALDAHRRRR